MKDLDALEIFGLIILCVALAAATTKYIENPIRFGNSRAFHERRSWRLTMLYGSLGVVFTLGFSALTSQGYPNRFAPEIRNLISYEYDFKQDAKVGDCWLSGTAGEDDFSPDCWAKNDGTSKERLVVWGDSHAARFTPGLIDLGGAMLLA